MIISVTVNTLSCSGAGEGSDEGAGEGCLEGAEDAVSSWPAGSSPRFIVHAGSANNMHNASANTAAFLQNLTMSLWLFIVFSLFDSFGTKYKNIV
jgi:hypothetical protein